MSTIIGCKPGTAVLWSDSGGNKLILPDGVVQYGAAQGDKSNSFLNAANLLPAFIRWRFEITLAVGTTTGREVMLYLGQSEHPSPSIANPGNLTGAAGNYPNARDMIGQLDWVGSLIFAATLGTNLHRVWLTSYPRSPYQIPVIYNNSGQTLSSAASAHMVQATPYYQSVEEI